MEFVTRIHLNPESKDRKELIDFCLLDPKDQKLAIGWSKAYTSDETSEFKDYQEFYEAAKCINSRTNPVLNIFKNVKYNDLFWTRDKEGYYWICRVISFPYPYLCKKHDIGALLPVEAYKYDTQVPGQIKASFNRRSGGTASHMKDNLIIEFSKRIYNQLTTTLYKYEETDIRIEDWLDNLPEFDLEELVISFIQIKYNFYALSNSIARNSTTVLIECEFMSRELNNKDRAVVQVKGKSGSIDIDDYSTYIEKGFKVFFFAKEYNNQEKYENNKNIIFIDRIELLDFYNEFNMNLPISITKWCDILDVRTSVN